MAIRVLEDKEPSPDVIVTRSELERLRREYEKLTHMVNVPSFEEYVRQNASGVSKNAG